MAETDRQKMSYSLAIISSLQVVVSPGTSSYSGLSIRAVFFSLRVSRHRHQTLRAVLHFHHYKHAPRGTSLLNNLCTSIMRLNPYR